MNSEGLPGIKSDFVFEKNQTSKTFLDLLPMMSVVFSFHFSGLDGIGIEQLASERTCIHALAFLSERNGVHLIKYSSGAKVGAPVIRTWFKDILQLALEIGTININFPSSVCRYGLVSANHICAQTSGYTMLKLQTEQNFDKAHKNSTEGAVRNTETGVYTILELD